MIALVEGAIRQRTPNEIALSIVLAAFSLIFLIVTAAALADGPARRERTWPSYVGGDGVAEPGHRHPDAGRAARLPDPDDDRRPAGGHRHRRAWTGPCGRTSSPRAARRSRWPATSTRCCWTRPARSRSATAGRRSSSRSATARPREVGRLAAPGVGGRPDARGQEHRRAGPPARRASAAVAPPAGARFVEFTAQTRMSGVDLPDGRRIRKGAPDAVAQLRPATRAARSRDGCQAAGRRDRLAGGDAAGWSAEGDRHRRRGRARRHPQAGHPRAVRAAPADGPARRSWSPATTR